MHQNKTNIYKNEHICLDKLKLSNIFEYLYEQFWKSSFNDCLNTSVALISNKYFCGWIYISRNIRVFKYIDEKWDELIPNLDKYDEETDEFAGYSGSQAQNLAQTQKKQ